MKYERYFYDPDVSSWNHCGLYGIPKHHGCPECKQMEPLRKPMIGSPERIGRVEGTDIHRRIVGEAQEISYEWKGTQRSYEFPLNTSLHFILEAIKKALQT